MSSKFYNLHSNLAEIVKKLMKNPNCKDRVMNWMRHGVDLNLEKQKIIASKPVASNGFVLNFIDLLL